MIRSPVNKKNTVFWVATPCRLVAGSGMHKSLGPGRPGD
jgi:hypothetical protein